MLRERDIDGFEGFRKLCRGQLLAVVLIHKMESIHDAWTVLAEKPLSSFSTASTALGSKSSFVGSVQRQLTQQRLTGSAKAVKLSVEAAAATGNRGAATDRQHATNTSRFPTMRNRGAATDLDSTRNKHFSFFQPYAYLPTTCTEVLDVT